MNEPMENIGLLCLTRFGDLIQTSPVTSGLRRRHPHARIHLIVKRRFVRAAELIAGVDQIHEIDGDALAQALSDPRVPFSEPLRLAREVVSRLTALRLDLVFNFTHSRASAVLLSLLEARQTVGFTLDRDGHKRVDDDWLVHIGTLVRARKLIRLNLVDAYLGAAGLHGSGARLDIHVSPSARAVAAARLAGPGPYLGVQLGASQDHKTWSVAHYASALRALHRVLPQVRVILLGVGAEAERAEALRQSCPEIAMSSLIGETSVGELAAVLERCALLLTGDTGTMHLAAAVGTRTCSVFVGLGNPYETAVYAEGHVTLRSLVACAPCSHLVRCGHPVCHDDFPAEWIAALLARLIEGRELDDLPALPRAELLRTRFDEHGMLELAPVHARRAEAHDLLALAFHLVFLERLAHRETDPWSAWHRAEQIHGVTPERWLESLPEDLPAALAELAALGEQGRKLSERLIKYPAARAGGREAAAALRALSHEIAQLDARVYALGRSQPLLAPLCLALEGECESLPGSDLADVAAASASHYGQLGKSARWLAEIVGGPAAAQNDASVRGFQQEVRP